jgi:hypothetical protein
MATIYMPLLNEGTAVWRRVKATRLTEETYQVESIMPADDEWAFVSGAVVRCELQTSMNGSQRLTAVAPAD